ncbi:MAG: helix-turn-helix transcriptional regulator [Burkholderiaceae bacterium]
MQPASTGDKHTVASAASAARSAKGPKTGQILAKNLKRYREAAGMTKKELAEKAGLTVNYVGTLDRGNVNISVFNLEKLAKVLGVEAYHLLVPPPK